MQEKMQEKMQKKIKKKVIKKIIIKEKEVIIFSRINKSIRLKKR